MSFLQNFHLSPGQTIRSTRGFKWNTGNNEQPQGQGQTQQNGQNSPLANKGQSDFTSNSNFMTTPIKQRGTNNPSLFNAPADQQQQVTDFNYTPSHQKPFIQPVSGTTVTTHQDIKEIVETTLGSEGVLNQAVKLPKGENENEWLAVHVVDFYNQINMLYGTITEFCSPESCPRMIATNEYEYLWSFEKGRSPVSVSAPKYVECLMRWCQDQFDDELIFPSRRDGVFPDRFIDKVIIPMLRRLFRVYAHIYCHHFNEILELNLQTVLNTSFRHFCLFAQEFNLLRPSDFGPLLELVTELRDR
ncbi:similar to Saccharomyces cerevisiae YIL106W MOB1 Component of the mitotic exit network [Maudiozyma saulgeensis]|uniref:Similar to Saccharomyces cerevisiae YIL106W MOB1 Component of the mitotic exit network n=1 Tax=Maudiozyma saulgeensis TaxID=1789683 RepID=A0A1X7R4L6_9SACH|nr:similar to Saccharomyces cerevisiae YIL106W MOB1 Component of the mitotic exit network [Kazachstania saulgeensis]